MEENHVLQDAVSSVAQETFGTLFDSVSTVFKSFFTLENLFRVIGICLILVVLTLLFIIGKKSIRRIPEEKIAKHYSFLIQKMMKYVFCILVVMCILSLFGVKLSAIWGAAGIAGVAIGFAAQTSVSNLISGLFVLGEKAVKVGDFIIAGGVSGTVDSIGLLSIKIHTLDNQMVRIPNSVIINSSLQNNSFFLQRRFTFLVSVAYSTDMEMALEAIKSVPALCPSVLAEPEPSAWYDGFGESGINLSLAVWLNSGDLVKVKNEVYIAIKKVFDEKGISIPYNKLDVEIVKGNV